jgi:hypothetical protein
VSVISSTTNGIFGYLSIRKTHKIKTLWTQSYVSTDFEIPMQILYTYWLGMRVIALLLFPRYQLFSEATPRKIVCKEGTIKVLLPKYQIYKYFNILNNCAIQNYFFLYKFYCNENTISIVSFNMSEKYSSPVKSTNYYLPAGE